MKILVFTEGTIIMHPSKEGLTREERVQQSKTRVRSVRDYKNYIPNGNAVEKIEKWKRQGAEIYYLASRNSTIQIKDIAHVLSKYKFPDNKNLLYRKREEQYKDVAERLLPNIIVEDDCESIGGEVEMTYPHIRPELKSEIKSVVVKEFSGIDSLPDSIQELVSGGKPFTPALSNDSND